MVPVWKAYVDIPAGQMHLRRVKGTGIPFILLHRTPVDSSSFTPVMTKLSKRGRTAIAIDTPGFGQSFQPDGNPSTTDYARWFLEAINALGIDDFHLVAHHTGTHFAVELALLADARVRSLTLSGVLHADAAERTKSRADIGLAPPVDSDGLYAADTWKIIRSFYWDYDPALVHQEFLGALGSPKGRNQAFDAIFAQDFAATLARVTCPVRVVQAFDDPLSFMLPRVAANHPDIPVSLIGPAGIAAPERQAPAFVSALLAHAVAAETLSDPKENTMTSRRFLLSADGQSFRLRTEDAPVPTPGPGEVLVRVRAVSINRRDIMIKKGFYPVNGANHFVPGSDAAGEVVAVGDGVESVKPGDRVCSTFFQNWPGGRINFAAFASALGAGGVGVFADHVLLSETGVVLAPEGWSFEQAATIPCAAVTAWSALSSVSQDDWVLIQGTGGVALYGLQIAVAAGARVLVISSSDAKLEKVRAMGAKATVNYQTYPDWDGEVQRLTGGGVQHVLELGGAGTLAKSIRATAAGGRIALVGGLDGFGGDISAADLVMGVKTVSAVAVGSRADHLAVTAFLAKHAITPVIERTFDADEMAEAFAAADAGAFGKVVVRL
ncbi:hypothetical protein CHU95_20935 [Niveispirillum lacus]|uniref:Enoyl reductase (ER) domain-containing protein n=1 Tax=Niveispirillum lacus TaxID=1981099 RepID=A0A255YQV8_9PROT|nr:alpha/beta fold hydrolase [Niveispirillum lacus]OYQ31607.1 hypothetical protein CHU95_20935 [Niveispirillum lacus]